ncbi:uncharacterized protein L203_105165 [Cryptococcus depauperatus CBS 7841]|uniref:CBM21 domain-containing protein n=1 Tax=Cryptococcus depauperatus CBS 7841 TaxID=1295531 RepID=A0AAJ8M292_9TREE
MMNRVPLFDLAALETGRSDAGRAPEGGNGSCAEKVPVLRNGPVKDASPILIAPPIPEREDTSVDRALIPLKPNVERSLGPETEDNSKTSTVVSRASVNHSSGRASPSRGVAVHVLPEVRSPSRKSLAMTEDSLPLAKRRGRRAKLFGFTELPGSSTSSPASSSQNSPDSTPLLKSQTVYQGNQSLPIASASTVSPFLPRHHPNVVYPNAPAHISPRRRENGLKLNFDGIIPIATSSEVQSASLVPSSYHNTLIRKKSGEILKSAMKRREDGTLTPGSESPLPRFESKSCPTTPSCPKYVHFDAQLERVKLFLHNQKPQVVSRDGTPTRDEEMEEFPFAELKEEERVLHVSLPNFPTSHEPGADLYLESLLLGDEREALKGTIMCKNIAFQKWVAVRFTFDWWQTTSEVTAVYKESVKGGKYDRFMFTIKLGDFLPRIEQKTLFLAVRYMANEREMWDSNDGQNYQVIFTRKAAPRQAFKGAREILPLQSVMGKAIGGKSSQWSVCGNKDNRMADLRAKLSHLTADDTDRPPLSPNSSKYSFFDSTRKGSPHDKMNALGSKVAELPGKGGALAARYDFGAALKTTRKNSNFPVDKPAEPLKVETGLLNFDSKVRTSHVVPNARSFKLDQNDTLSGDNVFTTSVSTVSSKTIAIPALKVQGPSPPEGSTPAEGVLPASVSSAPIVNLIEAPSVPAPKMLPLLNQVPLTRVKSAPARFIIGDPKENLSENLPPQLDSSDTASMSPPESPRSPPDLATSPKWSPKTAGNDSFSSLASYSSLIEQYCWAGDPKLESPRRTHSTSSLEQYFTRYSFSSGTSTPRASPSNAVSTPTPNSSYYTSFTNTTPTQDDVESVEDVLTDNFAGRVRPMVY